MAYYALADPPRGNSETFDALEGALGGEAFDLDTAAAVLSNELGMEPGEAYSHIRRLIANGNIQEV